jgi:NAD(P) transhydrogenase subunit alpha
VVAHGITILGPVHLVTTMAVHASQMYSRNVSALLSQLIVGGALKLDFEDEIVKGACVARAPRASESGVPA